MWSAQFCEGDSSCCSICLICSKWSKCSKCSKCSSWQKLSLQLPQDKFWWGDLVAAVTKRWIWPKIRSICQTWWTYWWSGLHEILFSKITKRQRDPAMQLVASVIEVLHNFTSFHNRRICKTLTQHDLRSFIRRKWAGVRFWVVPDRQCRDPGARKILPHHPQPCYYWGHLHSHS